MAIVSKALELRGSMEHLILNGIVELGEEAYGAALQRYAISQLGRAPAHGQVHRVIRRLEVRGFLVSHPSTIETAWGSRSTKTVHLSETGQRAWEEVR
jgi:DNA-binding PadR family transcriptional regulator